MTPLCGNCDAVLVVRDAHGHSYPYCPRCHSFWPRPDVLARVRQHRRMPPPGTTVSLVYEPNGTQHDDLVLRVGGWARRCDTYYMALDHAVGQPESVEASLRAMLGQWAASVAATGRHEVALLPFDFSDQYSGWLRCTREDEQFEIVPVWAQLEGWAFYPSHYLEDVERVGALVPLDDAEPTARSRDDLLADIVASLALLD